MAGGQETRFLRQAFDFPGTLNCLPILHEGLLLSLNDWTMVSMKDDWKTIFPSDSK